VFHAICMDPLTSACLSLSEIEEMTDEMFARNRERLPQFDN
jgi:alpha-galactosidase